MTCRTVRRRPGQRVGTVTEGHLDETFYALLDQIDPAIARAIEENVVDQRLALADRYGRCVR